MDQKSTKREQKVRVALATFVFFLALANDCNSQQASSAIQITSPNSNSIFAPGDSLTINVTLASGSSFPAGVAVVGEEIGPSAPLLNGPYTFTLPVSGSRMGARNLTAVGCTAPGDCVFSSPISIDVESSESPTSLHLNLSGIPFKFVGQQFSLLVQATLSSGSTLDVTKSTLISYSSQNPAVVRVDGTGTVTAAGSGQSQITVTYQGQSLSIPVSVPRYLKGDLNGDGIVDSRDLDVMLRALGTPATGANDARDLNGDGLIDASDAQILVGLCFRPQCATHVTQYSSTISWNPPSSITYGTPLSSQQLNASASVPGTFFYSPAVGTVLGVGTHTLFVSFRPSDSVHYTGSTLTVTLEVHYNFAWTIGKPAPALNFAEVGDGYKVAFSLGGNFGLNVVSVLTSTSIACSGPNGGGLPEAEGRPGLSYNSTTGNYQETFANPGASAAGTCTQVNLTLNDGTTQTIDIKYVN